MSLNVAIQMDPIERVRIAGDTGFALMLEAQARGHTLYTYTPDKLSMRDGKVTAPMRPVKVRDVEGDYFTAGAEEKVDLSGLDVVLLRQDPPFDMAYVTTTHMLERIHPKTLVVNDPTSVRNAPEKILVTHFPELMPPTLITRDRAEIEAFRDEHGEIVMKPLYGHGGATVFKTSKTDPNFGSLFDLFSNLFREPWVVQGFIKEVSEGDKRIILIDGKAAGAVNRVPAVGDLRANMVRGGAARPTDLSKQELAICEAIGPTLRERGLLLVGIDVIHGKLTEINVTAPTGVRAIKKLGGPDLAAQLFDVIEAKRGR